MKNQIIAVIFFAMTLSSADSAIEQVQQPTQQNWDDWARNGLNRAYQYLPSWYYAPAALTTIAAPILSSMGYKRTAPFLLGSGFGLSYALKGGTRGKYFNKYLAPGLAASLTLLPYGLWRTDNIGKDAIARASMLAGPVMILIGSILHWYARPLEDIHTLERDLSFNPSEGALAKYINPLVIGAALALGEEGLGLLLGYLEQRIFDGTLNAESLRGVADSSILPSSLDPFTIALSVASIALGGAPFFAARLALMARQFPLAYSAVMSRMSNWLLKLPAGAEQKIYASIGRQVEAARTGILIPGIRQGLQKMAPTRIPTGAYNPQWGTLFRGRM